MTKRFVRVLLSAAAITAAFAAPAAAQQVMRIQSLFNPSESVYLHMRSCLTDMSAKLGGKLKFDLLPVGAAVGPAGTAEAVGMGVLDGHFTYSPLWAGIEPAFSVLADLTGGHDDGESLQQFFYEDKGLPLLRKAYDRFGVHVAGILAAGIESMPSRKPIRSVADLKGMKIRVPTGITGGVFQRLGAAPVTMPMADAYGALEKGVVEAADISTLSGNHVLGIHQFAKYELKNSMHTNIALDLSFNKKKWTALPSDVRQTIESGMRPCSESWLKALKQADADVEPKLVAMGVTIAELAPQERAKFRAAAREVWEEFGSRNALAKESLDAQVAFMQARGALK